ncbi:MAG: glycosyltransferase, partial [Trueperaceae bacterium]
LFVSSSAWEGMPLVVIEAMAAARPVVVTDVGGSREVVGNDGCGVVVPPSDPGALARAILALVNDPERRRSMGSAARARARATFDIEGLIDAHLSIYREVTSRMHARRSTTEATAP